MTAMHTDIPAAEAPAVLFLQTHDAWGEPNREDVLTWCADRIHDTDVAYVRVDLAGPDAAALVAGADR